MTAYLGFPYPDRIELLADGATCLPSGMLVAATDKIVVSSHLPMAMVGRGLHRDLRQITDAIVTLSSCGSVDDTLDALAGSLDDVRTDPGEPPDQNFEIVIAAYSESRGALQYVLRSYELNGEPSWALIDKSGQMIGGGEMPSPQDVIDASLTAETFAIGAAEGGLALMEIMRRIPGSDPTREGATHGFWIGCHVDHAVVSADGVKVRRLRTWPDQLFRSIDPGSFLVTEVSAGADGTRHPISRSIVAAKQDDLVATSLH